MRRRFLVAIWLSVFAVCSGAQNSADAETVVGSLSAEEPATVTSPSDFSDLLGVRLPLFSFRGYTWTGVRFSLQGLNATDPYQPGRMIFFPDPAAVGGIAGRSATDTVSTAYGSEISIFAAESGDAWHGRLISAGTGSPFAWHNLPAPSERGLLQQSEHYRWFTRNSAVASGPLSPKADLLIASTGRWALQTIPQAQHGDDLRSRLLQLTTRVRVQLSARDQLDAHVGASFLSLSDWGFPSGLESLQGWRVSPPLDPPSGFQGLRESDSFGVVQSGWTRHRQEGVLAIRFGYTRAELDTTPTSQPVSPGRLDLVLGVQGRTPPLANRAGLDRYETTVDYTPGARVFAGLRNRLVLGGNIERAGIINRWRVPFNSNLIFARGAPASVIELNTPLDSSSRVWAGSAYARDQIRIATRLEVSLGVVADSSRAGGIVWRSLSPKLGISLAALRGITLRASYARLRSPLSGRLLDYGDPAGLSGLQYQWADRNADGFWQPDETGRLLARFGGRYSAIEAGLRRPYADEFNVGAEGKLPRGISASLLFFRRDEKDRIAAINTGVPTSAFSRVEIPDAGPDGLQGTFDDQTVTVYSQEPSTLGRDRYLLTNPPNLRMLHKGLVAELGGGWEFLKARASFMAVKAHGPTNPGNGVLENDGGVVGALFQDPNTLVNAAGRTYFDRAYVGKAQISATLPWKLELASIVNYLDGLVFGRRILVTGLAQGPFLVAATVRGSPEGGNRTQYLLNWNMRIARRWRALRGGVALSLDLLNLLNAANKSREIDASGASFNQRLPVSIQPPRYTRINIEYSF